jgi:hypothetical protein
VIIQHEGTKGTKDHEATPFPTKLLWVWGRASWSFVPFVPSC